MSTDLSIHAQLQAIKARLQAEASPEAGKSAAYFIPGIQKQYGVRMPVLNEIANLFKSGGLPLADALWIEGSHEEQLLAARIIGKLGRKDPEAVLEHIERYSAGINNWAVCDALGMQAIHGIRENTRSNYLPLHTGWQWLKVSGNAGSRWYWCSGIPGIHT